MTNSPTENAKPSSPTQQSPREMVEQAVQALILETIQLRRTLWLILEKTGPQTIDETKCDPLWKLSAKREGPGVLTLASTKMPQPTPEQLLKLAQTLSGTILTIPQAATDTMLADHNPAMLALLLSPLVKQAENGLWVPQGALTQDPL